jgi:glycosyltransferase involved in cell wall biosynthesis
MSDNKRISVIVPVYKVENYLDRCVQSILDQTWTDLEILLVDDGSPDNSGAMCDQWALRDSRIRVIHKPNGGLSSARNAGLEEAKGAYIMFIDSDDVIHPDMCRILLELAENHQAQIVSCEPAHTFDDEEPPFTTDSTPTVLTSREAISRMWYQTGFFPSACTKLFTRKVFQTQRFTEGILFEDVDIMHRLLWEAKTAVTIPAALYGYMHRGESITTNTFSLRDLDILPIAQGLLDFAQENDHTLLGAARAYCVTAAMRVELNAPQTPEFDDGRRTARNMLKEYGTGVLFDRRTRIKTKGALALYFCCRPLMRHIYKRIDRWK